MNMLSQLQSKNQTPGIAFPHGSVIPGGKLGFWLDYRESVGSGLPRMIL